MQLAGAVHHHAAVVVIGCDFLALALARDHARARFSSLVVHRHLVLLVGIVPRREGADEAAPKVPVTLDAFALDDAFDVLERLGRVVQHRCHPHVHLPTFYGALAGEALADRRAAAHRAAAEGARTHPEIAALQHGNLATRTRDLEGGRKAGIASADHQHVGPGRRIL